MKCQLFTKPPIDFKPAVEAAGCYCEYGETLLFVKRHPERPQGNTWGVPGGKLEKGEDPRTAVVREFLEEVGLDIDDEGLEDLKHPLYVRLPHVDYVFHMFRKRYDVKPQLILQMEEHLEAKWITISEAMQMPLIAGGHEALQYYLDCLKK